MRRISVLCIYHEAQSLWSILTVEYWACGFLTILINTERWTTTVTIDDDDDADDANDADDGDDDDDEHDYEDEEEDAEDGDDDEEDNRRQSTTTSS